MSDQGNSIHRVDIQPIGLRVEITAGQTVLEAIRAAGIEMVTLCGGSGWCYTCLVKPLSGTTNPVTPSEREGLGPALLAAGFRLACKTVPLSDIKIEIPPDSLSTEQRLQLEGIEPPFEVKPMVEAVDVRLPPATLEDLRADVPRLEEAVEALTGAKPFFPHALLRSLSVSLREQQWEARLGLRRTPDPGPSEVVSAARVDSPLLGFAVDIGTTKMAAYLVDLATGQTIAKKGAVNPQVAYGEDVLSRIGYCDEHPDGREVLRLCVVDTLNEMVTALCGETGTARDQIADAVIVGNTAIHHLCAGLPVSQLGSAPYVAVVSDPLDIRSCDLGLRFAPGAYVHLPSIIAGFVGADHVAMALGTGVWETDRTVVAVDIGTNTEVTLATGGRAWSCSCASGPAFEGAHIVDGMRAAGGAIERVQIVDGQVRLKVIDNLAPIGICGSGMIDALSELVKAGLINRKGLFVEGAPGVMGSGKSSHYVLADAASTGHGKPVTVTRKDIQEIQLAKAAIRVGIDILLHEAKVAIEEIDEFIVAGAFGTYLDIESTVRTGMFPQLPLDRFRQVGNAAGAGARQLLVSSDRRRFAAQRARQVTYVELTNHPEFTQRYLQSLYF